MSNTLKQFVCGFLTRSESIEIELAWNGLIIMIIIVSFCCFCLVISDIFSMYHDFL